MTFKVVGVGELLWDLLPDGKKMGGAPANFAYHAHAFGAEARIISRVGRDALGRELLESLNALALQGSGISVDPVHPTGTVSVEFTGDGQPHYTIHENVAWDHLVADESSLAIAGEADAICFGTLAQRNASSRAAIRTILSRTPPDALRIFDVNLRQDYFSAATIRESLELANVVKLNDHELPVLAKLLPLKESTEREQLAELINPYRLRLAAYTRGARGSVLYDGHSWVEHSGFSTRVQDTIGAGDSFTAVVTLGLLAGWHLEKISGLANQVAAYVCSCPGAMPPIPAHLTTNFAPLPATDG